MSPRARLLGIFSWVCYLAILHVPLHGCNINCLILLFALLLDLWAFNMIIFGLNLGVATSVGSMYTPRFNMSLVSVMLRLRST